jgi:hypothetical protein
MRRRLSLDEMHSSGRERRDMRWIWRASLRMRWTNPSDCAGSTKALSVFCWATCLRGCANAWAPRVMAERSRVIALEWLIGTVWLANSNSCECGQGTPRLRDAWSKRPGRRLTPIGPARTPSSLVLARPRGCCASSTAGSRIIRNRLASCLPRVARRAQRDAGAVGLHVYDACRTPRLFGCEGHQVTFDGFASGRPHGVVLSCQ